MDAPKSKTRVFLSYSHRDRAIVSRVASLLNQRGVDVWFDEWQLVVGSSLIQEIESGIRQADFIVLFISTNSMASPWVHEEYEASKIRQIESKDKVRILPARLDDCEMPSLLRSRIFADFRTDFVYGFTGLLKAVQGTPQMTPLDLVFAHYAERLNRLRTSRAKFSGEEYDRLQHSITEARISRWVDACYSSRDLALTGLNTDMFGNHAPERMIYRAEKFEEELGNTIRNFIQYKLYNSAMRLMESQKDVAALDVMQLATQLLEYLYTSLNENIRLFGLPNFRHAEEYIVSDVNRIFSFLPSEESVGS